MTITAQTAKSGPYAGNGSTTSFSYTFYIRAESDLVVTRLSTAGVETVLTLNVNYTVSGVGAANGGAVDLTVAPTTGQQLVITRLVSITQALDLQNRAGVNPDALEAAYDKLTQIAQDQQEQISRSVKVDLFGATIGITGTKAQFNAVLTDGNFLYDGDVNSIVGIQGTKAQFNTALTDGGFLYNGDVNSIVGIQGTMSQFNAVLTDGNFQYVGDAPTAHTHLLTELVGVTMGAVDLNELDDGVSTTLHFHNSDRSRANHTGTQNLATISDVTVTAANLNILDDGLTTALHFHDSDRARANHTGTQLAATISDFSAAVAAAASVTANTAKVTNATHTGDVTGATALTIAPTAISGKTLATAAGADHVLIFDATDSLLKKALVSDFNSGVSDGDKGDITVSAAGTTWTIDASTVTLAKQANMATGSLVYRKTAGAGAPEVQTLATLKTDLGLTGTNSGDQTITLTGAVTGSGVGSFVTAFTGGAVDTAALGALAVTSIKISPKAVGTGRIDDAAVTPAQMKIKAVVALADAGATLSATQLVDSGIFTITPTGARNLTTSTATNIIAQLPDYQVGTWFDFTIVNLAAFNVNLLAGAGVTIVGSNNANNVAATWKCLVTSSTTVTIYRS